MRDEAHTAVDRLFDAIERALSEKSHDAQTAARDDARRLWIDLTRIVDQGDVLSDAYWKESAEPDKETKHKGVMDTAAMVMQDLSGAFNGWAATSLGAVAGDIIDRIQGRSTTGILDSLELGQGNRKRSIVVKTAMQEFTILVHYKSGRDSLSIPESLASTPVMLAHCTFKNRQIVVSKYDRRSARDLGAAVREGVTLTMEQQAIADRLDAILSDPENLRLRANAILGVFDPLS